MTSVIFVHGTGVREPQYSGYAALIRGELASRRPDVAVVDCYWGAQVGSRVNAASMSVPLSSSAGALNADSSSEQEIALWAYLYDDPLFELRILTGGPGVIAPQERQLERSGQALAGRLEALAASPALEAKLREAGLDGTFATALRAVSASETCREALTRVGRDPGAVGVIGRAVVAEAMLECEREGRNARILLDATLRDEVVSQVCEQLGADPDTRPRTAGYAIEMARAVAMHRRRGAMTDATFRAAADA